MNDDVYDLLHPVDESGKQVQLAPRPAPRSAPAGSQRVPWYTWPARMRARTKRNQTHSVLSSQSTWHAWLRTHTPLWGSRRHGRIALRPIPRVFSFVLASLVVFWAGVWLMAAGLGVASGPVWADPIAIALLLASMVYVSRAPFRRGPVVAASQLQPGMLVRQPRRPYSARIVTRVTTIAGISYVQFHNGPDRTYAATYEASTVTLPKTRTRNWHYGRI